MAWLYFIGFEIFLHWFLIVVWKQRPKYKYVYMWRIFWGIIFFFKAHPEFDPAGDVTTIFPAVVYGLFQFTSFYISFDLILNLLRGKSWDYRGKNSGDLDKVPDTKYYLLKAACLVVLILTLFVMYAD